MLFPRDTLVYQKTRALAVPQSMEGVACAHIGGVIKALLASNKPDAAPEADALWFYGMNHGMSEIGKKYAPLEPLPPDVLKFVDHYYTAGAEKALRSFAYLMLISVREARHLPNKGGDMKSQLATATGSDVLFNYLKAVPSGPGEAKTYFADVPPAGMVIPLLKGLIYQFKNGGYGKSYGGPAWAKITECALAFAEGKATAEVMLDTVWTLNHNNGAIFNKSVLFQMHTETLNRILDVQRAGMIPQMIATYPKVQLFTDDSMISWNNWLRVNFPQSTTGKVDWQRVQSLGAVGNYSFEIDQQKKEDPAYLAKLEAEKQKMPAANKVQQEALKAKHAAELDKMNSMYQVSKDVWVPKFKPVRPNLAKAA